MTAPVDELLQDTCRRIVEAHDKCTTDIAAIRGRQKNWMVADMEIERRRALYVLETYDLRRLRHSLMETQALAPLSQIINPNPLS